MNWIPEPPRDPRIVPFHTVGEGIDTLQRILVWHNADDDDEIEWEDEDDVYYGNDSTEF